MTELKEELKQKIYNIFGDMVNYQLEDKFLSIEAYDELFDNAPEYININSRTYIRLCRKYTKPIQILSYKLEYYC